LYSRSFEAFPFVKKRSCLSFKTFLSVTLNGLAFQFGMSKLLQGFVRKNFSMLCGFRLPPRCKWDLLFWELTQRRKVVSYRRFGINYPPLLKGSRSPRRSPKSAQVSIFFSNSLEYQVSSVNNSEYPHKIQSLGRLTICIHTTVMVQTLFQTKQYLSQQTLYWLYQTNTTVSD